MTTGRQKWLPTLKKLLRDNKLTHHLYNKLYYHKFERVQHKTFSTLKKLEGFTEKDLKELQQKILLNWLDYAYQNTTYYRDLFDKHGIDHRSLDDFYKIPFLTKDLIRGNTKALIGKRYDSTQLGMKKTGGSTGEPLAFYSVPATGMINHGHLLYLYSFMGYQKGDVIVGGGGTYIPEELREKNIFWKKLNKGNVSGAYLFSGLYFAPENIGLYVDKICSLKPAILRGHSSFYATLANYILDHDIKLDFEVKGIVLTAEICPPNQRQRIEKAFKTKVFFEYGHSEACLFCYTKDETMRYHSSPIFGYVEVLNDDGSPTELGQVGQIVVTGFVNKAMPFIRYETGDMGKLYHRNGGIVILDALEGRSQDYIVAKNGQKWSLTAVIFAQHFNAFAAIRKWQIVQDKIGAIDIRIVKEKDYSEEDEIELRNKIQNIADVSIDFYYVEDIPKTQSGKHLFLVQKLAE